MRNNGFRSDQHVADATIHYNLFVAMAGLNKALRSLYRSSVSVSSQSRRAVAGGSSAVLQLSSAATQSFALPDLSYDYGELAPHIAPRIMEVHHSKHHQTYVTNLNNSLEQYEKAEASGDVAKMVALQGAIKFNGGGHVNHTIFWKNLAPPGKGGGGEPEGELAGYIDREFGSFGDFKTTFAAKTAAVQGSGWGWLGYDSTKDKVAFQAMANQDPLSVAGLVPLLGIDVWEHAYYLQYENRRPDYLKEIWSIVNWGDVAERLAAAKATSA